MRTAARLAALGWLAIVFAITLSPHNTNTQARGDRAVAAAKSVRHQVDLPTPKLPSRIQARETDLIGNVLLFVPLGFLAVVAFPQHRKAIAVAGPLLSGAIETFQMGYLPHRHATLGDVFTNSTGHYAGMAAAIVVLAAARRRTAAVRT
ncbi:MAG TPA: VanZ family protein [Acidimicrobiales bacterium]|nr:VanZ family protein [Acidimicrobiales bacterium]